MKRRLLLNLGLIAILGMAQTVDASSIERREFFVRSDYPSDDYTSVANEVFTKLAPEDQTELLKEIFPQKNPELLFKENPQSHIKQLNDSVIRELENIKNQLQIARVDIWSRYSYSPDRQEALEALRDEHPRVVEFLEECKRLKDEYKETRETIREEEWKKHGDEIWNGYDKFDQFQKLSIVKRPEGFFWENGLGELTKNRADKLFLSISSLDAVRINFGNATDLGKDGTAEAIYEGFASILSAGKLSNIKNLTLKAEHTPGSRYGMAMLQRALRSGNLPKLETLYFYGLDLENNAQDRDFVNDLCQRKLDGKFPLLNKIVTDGIFDNYNNFRKVAATEYGIFITADSQRKEDLMETARKNLQTQIKETLEMYEEKSQQLKQSESEYKQLQLSAGITDKQSEISKLKTEETKLRLRITSKKKGAQPLDKTQMKTQLSEIRAQLEKLESEYKQLQLSAGITDKQSEISKLRNEVKEIGAEIRRQKREMYERVELLSKLNDTLKKDADTWKKREERKAQPKRMRLSDLPDVFLSED